MKKLVIYGLSNPVVVKLVESINRQNNTFDLLGFIKAPGNDPLTEIFGYPVLGNEDRIPELTAKNDIYFFCNVNYSPSQMKEGDMLLDRFGCQTISLIHPAIDMNHVRHGKNVMLCDGSIVGPGVSIGDHLTCRLGSIISHEVTIENYVYISPGVKICGEAHLREMEITNLPFMISVMPACF